jgi:hypothetical protein
LSFGLGDSLRPEQAQPIHKSTTLGSALLLNCAHKLSRQPVRVDECVDYFLQVGKLG